ncbi:MAG: nicotinamide riboside transporter PnuC [Bacteroidales bacterium]|jgi:nicotinamide mononucleotide transporter|nr:nicotinamide riboside transporter PnuC [Bacteroidales bacterium]
MNHRILKYFDDWDLFEKIWLSFFTLLILTLSIYWEDDLVGVVASLAGIWSVVLVAKGKIINYYFGIINVLAYAFVAYNQKYYGEVMLNMLYFFPMQFVGFYLWSKKRVSPKKDDVKVNYMTQTQRLVWFGVTVIGTIVYGLVLKRLEGNMPFLDAASTVMSVIAMMLMVHTFVEQWILWILVDVVTIIMWIVVLLNGGNDIAILVMWVAYLINAIYGMSHWIKLAKKKY